MSILRELNVQCPIKLILWTVVEEYLQYLSSKVHSLQSLQNTKPTQSTRQDHLRISPCSMCCVLCFSLVFLVRTGNRGVWKDSFTWSCSPKSDRDDRIFPTSAIHPFCPWRQDTSRSSLSTDPAETSADSHRKNCGPSWPPWRRGWDPSNYWMLTLYSNTDGKTCCLFSIGSWTMGLFERWFCGEVHIHLFWAGSRPGAKVLRVLFQYRYQGRPTSSFQILTLGIVQLKGNQQQNALVEV